MAYQADYHNAYASYSRSSVAYADHQHHAPSPHPVSPAQHSHPAVNERSIPVPQSPSSFIYNKATAAPYPAQQAVYGHGEPNHVAYHQQYHPQTDASVSVVYRHPPHERAQSGDDQRHRQPQHAYIPSLQPQQQHDYHHSPRPSPPQQHSASTQEAYGVTEVPISLSDADDRLMRYHFPQDSQDYLRRALYSVLNAPWKRANNREPTDEVLLQFTSRDGKLYHCSFSKAEGACSKSFDRKDRVMDHIRTHIDLQPFVCRDVGCYQRFCSKPDLLQHEKNKEKTQCDQW